MPGALPAVYVVAAVLGAFGTNMEHLALRPLEIADVVASAALLKFGRVVYCVVSELPPQDSPAVVVDAWQCRHLFPNEGLL
ncbi:hypothetical protein A0H81_09409 [Grifola frondosa]|uniref:Uncharacterized protein n=1 Tax=Grifola frondosa TaxID=5627 RepID=A0A1C7M110_GRIFR|nr:hypothetical protein A0H81_09409 [Grifola frondosa]